MKLKKLVVLLSAIITIITFCIVKYQTVNIEERIEKLYTVKTQEDYEKIVQKWINPHCKSLVKNKLNITPWIYTYAPVVELTSSSSPIIYINEDGLSVYVYRYTLTGFAGSHQQFLDIWKYDGATIVSFNREELL